MLVAAYLSKMMIIGYWYMYLNNSCVSGCLFHINVIVCFVSFLVKWFPKVCCFTYLVLAYAPNLLALLGSCIFSLMRRLVAIICNYDAVT